MMNDYCGKVLGMAWKPTSCRDRMDEIKVATYTRVSSNHVAQLSAFDNQVEWMHSLLKYRPNWKIVREFEEPAVSGTDVKKRLQFKAMINEAKTAYEKGEEPPFDLIIVREVSRFSRNILDSIDYVRKLKKYGVEVYFVQQNIFTFTEGMEAQFVLLAQMAESEALHTSERARAGQAMSRQPNAKGEPVVLYGNGNILGYDLVKKKDGERSNTYVINEKQAECVRFIYEKYLEGNGMKRIVSLLIENKMENTLGEVKWDTTTVSRILTNATYCGKKRYGVYLTVDPLTHERKKNLDESTYQYQEGDWEPIVSEEDWQKVQKIRKSKRRVGVTKGKGLGKKEAEDRFTRKMICQCGRTFKRNPWGTNQNGEKYYGYHCRNVVAHRKRSFHVSNGLSGEGFCDMPSIPQWKLDYQFLRVMERFFDSPEILIDNLYQDISENYVIAEEK